MFRPGSATFFAKPAQHARYNMELQPQVESVSIAIGQQTAFCVPALERHYTVSELAKLWFFSENTIRRLFSQEPGVIKLSRQRTRVKRGYTSMRIPERIAQRVHRRLQGIN
jgi:hypothetical protein